jgi:putative transcriptional regulator
VAFSSAVAVLAGALGLAGLHSIRPVAAPSVAHQRPPFDERLNQSAVAALAAGKLLVAARRLPDPNFAKTVVLLAGFGPTGAMGIVVNRPADLTVARVFPNLTPNLATAGHAFLGGPVDRIQALGLVRTPEAPAGSRHIVDGVHLVASREALEALLRSGPSSSRLRVYLGYAGWGPGQLENETAQGAWHVLEADGDVVFAADPPATWQHEIARVEVIQARRQAASGMLGAG